MQGTSSESKVRGMFSSCKPVNGKLGMSEFEKLVGMLSETEKQTKAEVDAQFELTLENEDEMDDIEISGLDEDDEDEEEEEDEAEEEEEENVIEAAMRKGVVNLTPENQRTDFITMKPIEDSKKTETEENEDGDEDEVRLL